MKKQETIWVRNNGAQVHKDRYDGEDFSLEPGESIEMLVEAATLCFGLGEEDKTRALRRLGWATVSTQLAHALERLNAFSFHATEAEANGHAYAPVGGTRPAGSEQHSDQAGASSEVDPEMLKKQPGDVQQPPVSTTLMKRAVDGATNLLNKLATTAPAG